jgi:sugar lactone lactonase YvrE
VAEKIKRQYASKEIEQPRAFVNLIDDPPMRRACRMSTSSSISRNTEIRKSVTRNTVVLLLSVWMSLAAALVTSAEETALTQHWLWSTAHQIPKELTSEQSGYFSIVEGHNGRIYVGTAKYGSNAYLVEFDPTTKQMKVVVDAQKEIGSAAKGFAAQAKIHTRNNVGKSGKIYFGTKQGYPLKGESRDSYLGGYPMVYSPKTGKTKVYKIPIAKQGIISVTPDESRNIAYVSSCSDERPIESSHFLKLDLETGEYQDLMDCRHMYAFIVVDHLGRAYHPVLGGKIARYNPQSNKVELLNHTIDGKPPSEESLLAAPKSHPINWDISADKKTLYSVAMSGNQLFSYDLTKNGKTLDGRSHGKLIPSATKTDCRAMCVAPNGRVWMGIAATFPKRGQLLHVVSYAPGDSSPTDHGPIAISNPNYTDLTDADGKALKWHHGVHSLKDGTMKPRYVIMGICAAKDETVYVTTLYPFTLHAIRIPKVAGVTTTYYHNSHSDVILSRLVETDTLDGKGLRPTVELHSLFTDQVPENDKSRKISSVHSVPIHSSIAKSLRRGSGQVDGVLMVAEHGKYPESDTGQFIFPKRRFFAEIAAEFERTGKVVPVFCDKHLSDNWRDAKWIYDRARELEIPMMAGSSLPITWRYPPTDVRRGAKLKQIVLTSYHRLDTYGFHAMEIMQALAERRAGGETGIAKVQCLSGEKVWEAAERGVFDRQLFDEAISRLKEKPLPPGKRLEDLAKSPDLLIVDYKDGLRACIVSLNYAVLEWSAAWRYADNTTDSTLFWTQELRPFHHFGHFLKGIEKMFHTGKPTWPVERTLMTSGALDALLISKKRNGAIVKTPYLNIEYQTQWNWQQPPPPPVGRPIREQ